MKLPYRFSIFLLLTLMIEANGYAQETLVRKTPQDTLIPKNILENFAWDIYSLKEKIKLQEYEIRVLKQLGKVDSLRYGKDSLIILYTSTNGTPLMRITQKIYIPQRKYNDSIVVYYNKNGLIEYQELWHVYERQKHPLTQDSSQKKTKLTCRRYEYDDQNRVIRYIGSFPTPKTMEYIYTYDSLGKQTESGHSISPLKFWDEKKIESAGK